MLNINKSHRKFVRFIPIQFRLVDLKFLKGRNDLILRFSSTRSLIKGVIARTRREDPSSTTNLSVPGIRILISKSVETFPSRRSALRLLRHAASSTTTLSQIKIKYGKRNPWNVHFFLFPFSDSPSAIDIRWS